MERVLNQTFITIPFSRLLNDAYSYVLLRLLHYSLQRSKGGRVKGRYGGEDDSESGSDDEDGKRRRRRRRGGADGGGDEGYNDMVGGARMYVCVCRRANTLSPWFVAIRDYVRNTAHTLRSECELIA